MLLQESPCLYLTIFLLRRLGIQHLPEIKKSACNCINLLLFWFFLTIDLYSLFDICHFYIFIYVYVINYILKEFNLKQSMIVNYCTNGIKN